MCLRVLCVCICLLLGIPYVSVSASSHIEITELNFAGSIEQQGRCKSVVSDNRCGFDKWVEITNFGNSVADISGWKLRMNQGNGTNEWFTFPQSTGVVSNGSVVVGYTEVNFVSTLSLAGIPANFVTYSMLRMSNNTSQEVHIALIDAAGALADSANFSVAGYAKNSSKFSLERLGESWVPATSEYYAGNLGTPNSYGFTTNIITPIAEEVGAILISENLAVDAIPSVVEVALTTQPVIEPAILHQPAVIPSPVFIANTTTETSSIIHQQEPEVIAASTAATSSQLLKKNVAETSYSLNYISETPIYSSTAINTVPTRSLFTVHTAPVHYQVPVSNDDTLTHAESPLVTFPYFSLIIGMMGLVRESSFLALKKLYREVLVRG